MPDRRESVMDNYGGKYSLTEWTKKKPIPLLVEAASEIRHNHKRDLSEYSGFGLFSRFLWVSSLLNHAASVPASFSGSLAEQASPGIWLLLAEKAYQF
jgi:hypothetical protein